MGMIEVAKDRHGQPVELYYQDAGSGSPVVLIHGWPVTQAMWEYQVPALVEAGHRVIAYDRRGFGASSKPWGGYDYDTMTDDLKALLDALDLDQVTLVGFSMGGGEVARYMGRHAGARVARVVFISAVTPYLVKTDDNPDGVDPQVFKDMITPLQHDRPAFQADFAQSFFGQKMFSHPLSQAMLDWHQGLTLMASPKATIDCVHAFAETDFRDDLRAINVPALVIHGKKDQTVPIEVSAERAVKLLGHGQLLAYDDAPHGLYLTHVKQLNADLVRFCGSE